MKRAAVAVGLAVVVVWTVGRDTSGPVSPAAATPSASPAVVVGTREQRLSHRLIVERREHHAFVRRYRTLVGGYDAEVAMRAAGVAYGVDWRQLRSCALSEGYRNAERSQAVNARVNRTGSGAVGAWQFMPGTYAGTPQGRAGLPINSVTAQAMAAAWMVSVDRRGEWTGSGCR